MKQVSVTSSATSRRSALGKTARLVGRGQDRRKDDDQPTEQVQKFLGPAPFTREEQQEHDEIGVATGLAWTAVGGEILYVETTTMKGKGSLILHRPARRCDEGVRPRRLSG